MTEQQKFEAWASIYQMRPAGWTEACWNAWQARAAQDKSAELLEALQTILPEMRGLALLSPLMRDYVAICEKAIAKARAAIGSKHE